MMVTLNMGIRRHEKIWEIPERALREALVNAVIHNDYNLGDPITVRVFSDRVEIENNTISLGGIRIDDLSRTTSEIRNPVITSCFIKSGYVERIGTGIAKMAKDCTEAGLRQPSFERVGSHSLRVTFFKEKILEPAINDIDRFIIDLVRLCGPLSTSQIASVVGRSRGLIVDRLTRLASFNQLVIKGSSPNDPKRVYGKYISSESARSLKTLESDSNAYYISVELYNCRINLIILREFVDIENYNINSDSMDKFIEDIILGRSGNEEQKRLVADLRRAILDGLSSEGSRESIKKQKLSSILLAPYDPIFPVRDMTLEKRRMEHRADAVIAFQLPAIGFKEK